MKILLFFLLVFSVILVGAIIVGLIKTHMTNSDPNQKMFLSGSVPNPLPDGFQKGTVEGVATTWQGKSFARAEQKGINIFTDQGKKSEAFPFKTYIGQSVQSHSLRVLKIDYNIPENSLFTRFILDEVVEVQPGKYLGKLNLMIIPFLPMSIGWFRLENPTK